MCRGELPAVTARLMSKCLWSGWKWYRGLKEIASLFPYCPVNHENTDRKKNYVVALAFYIKIMKRITLQACSLKNSIQKVFSVYGKLNLFKSDRRGESSPSSLWLHTWKYTDCPTKNYGNTIHYNGIAVIFCGTVCILYHNGNRLRLINRGLLFNLKLSTEYQKFKVNSARWHSWSKETRRAHVKSYPTTSPLFRTNLLSRKMLVENLEF